MTKRLFLWERKKKTTSIEENELLELPICFICGGGINPKNQLTYKERPYHMRCHISTKKFPEGMNEALKNFLSKKGE